MVTLVSERVITSPSLCTTLLSVFLCFTCDSQKSAPNNRILKSGSFPVAVKKIRKAVSTGRPGGLGDVLACCELSAGSSTTQEPRKSTTSKTCKTVRMSLCLSLSARQATRTR